MKTKNIKVNVENANSELDQRTFDRVMKKKGTINLSNRKTTTQRLQSIEKRKRNTPEAKIMRFTAILLPTVLLILIGSLWIRTISAENLTLETEFERIAEKEEIVEADVDLLIELIDEEYNSLSEDTVNITPENIEASDKAYREAKEEIKPLEFNIDRLSYAVSMAETSWYSKWYGVTHNNWHGIKHWNTAPCPWVPKLYMCKFNNRGESHEAFKLIWQKWYGEFPTYAMADRWTGWDNTSDWLRIVNFYYMNWPKQ